jgi:glycerate dehydrogenase
MTFLIAEHKGVPERRAGCVPLDVILEQCDVLTLHCPLTAETRGMTGACELSLMTEGALLINCARGGIVDESALADALAAGRIGGAGIDSLEDEPPLPNNPLLKVTIGNLIMTPHVAWASQGSLANMAEQLVENVEAFVLGKPRNLVA